MATDQGAFVVVGGGQAGAWVALTLRSEGYQGRVLLIGEESHSPYERPPLSKTVLLGAGDDEGALLTAEQASALNIELWLGQRVIQIDRAAKRVTCADGRFAAYDKLFLTTGSRPRELPLAADAPADRIHYLRTRADAARLRSALRSSRRLLVLGGGWIGLEVAASASKLGVQVTVLEAAPRVCARSVASDVSTYLQGLHASHGVEIRLAAAVTALSAAGRGLAAALGDGSVFAADHVLIGIGVLPNVQLAESCGLAVDNGVVVDSSGRTSDPDIYAAGDATNHFSRFAGKHVRLESWANAQGQAIVAAKAALGKAVAYDEVPWVWSDQFDVNFQIAGFPDQGTSVLTRGEPSAGSGCWLMLDAAGAVVGAVAVNAPRDLRSVRKAMQSGDPIDLSAWRRLAAA